MVDSKVQQYLIRYELDNNVCQKCGIYATRIAHRIANTKVNRKKYTSKIVAHNMNLVSACSKKGTDCNDSYNIGMIDQKCNRLVDLIKQRGNERLTSAFITEYINE